MGQDQELGRKEKTHVSKVKLRSEWLFEGATGIDPCALTIERVERGLEFSIFMDMHSDMQWKPFEMTPKRWADATTQYNANLQSILGHFHPKKHPRALVNMLADVIRKTKRKDLAPGRHVFLKLSGGCRRIHRSRNVQIAQRI
ncbi:hypothetical protein DFH08DRAFT_783917 [Mycena albidolilacea]|uniref:Uncharacterized protein n=1 Tax=Mycena albidolilacea TaxID=1033008 RepID=A0AAD6ZSZ4_9AGAR|nr:hypothetical protein DFH08DRAFT_783917 [Mycena albidolilacea]